LGLVNDICHSLNEVPLTTGTFPTATGFYNDAKQSVNKAINRLNQQEWEWFFNFETIELTLATNQVEYSLRSDVKIPKWDTFRLKGDPALGIGTIGLFLLDYEEYITDSSDYQYRPELYSDIPTTVVRTPANKVLVLPPTDGTYQKVVYDAYLNTETLVDATDVPRAPESFKNIINSASMYYAYKFRGDMEAAVASMSEFDILLKDARATYTNRYEYVRSTQIRG
jgi:hypothetical protein